MTRLAQVLLTDEEYQFLRKLMHIMYQASVVLRDGEEDRGNAALLNSVYTQLRGAQGVECESCRDCGQPYTVWYADNDLWNAVMGYDGPGMLCPRCFLVRAEPVTEFARITWPETPSRRDRERTDYQGPLDPEDGSWQHNDVAVYSYPPYPGEEPVRVTVGFCAGDRTWRNVASGGVIQHSHIRAKGGLTLLVRDGITQAKAEAPKHAKARPSA